MDIDTVMRAHWSPPTAGDRIISITQMRDYVILITEFGYVWRAEGDSYRDTTHPLFRQVGSILRL